MSGAPDRIAAAFAAQSRACRDMGSPFMAALMDLTLAAMPAGALRDRIVTWPGDVGPDAASVPLRLAAGLHALVLTGRVAPLYRGDGDGLQGLAGQVQDVVARHVGFLMDWLDHAPQTNEVGRSAVLIPVAGMLARRFGLALRLSELGASAGLNLGFDRYGLVVRDGVMGDADSAVRLTPDWREAPPLGNPFAVADRRGCDLNPLDPGSDGLRLMAYVWADQPDRLARLRAALGLAQAGLVDQADAADWLEVRLSAPWDGQCHLVYHTVAHQYFPEPVKDRIARAMASAGARASLAAPLAWFGMEADASGPGAALTLRLWPGDLHIPLGRAGFHGQWIDWRQM